MGLVDRIKDICVNAGTTIGAVERELGFGKGTMYRWNDMIPSADKVQRVADYFNVSIDYLMGREKPAAESDGLSELDKELISLLRQVTPEQEQRVMDFVQGILASK